MALVVQKRCRAVVIEKPRRVVFREIELTEPAAGAVIARTLFSAISSGTDMKTYRGLQPPQSLYYPLVPGYENVGVIEAVDGPGTGFEVGDRVMINEVRRFGNLCSAWGGGTEISIKDHTTMGGIDAMARIPDNVSDTDAVLAYLACVALKGVKRLPLADRKTVVVTGAGMVGISMMQLLKIYNPTLTVVAIDPNAFRRSIAGHYADYVLAPERAEQELLELTSGKKADIVVECSGDTNLVGTLHRYLKDGGWGATDEPGHIHLQGDYPGRIVMDAYNFWFTKNCTITMTCALAPGGKEEMLRYLAEGKFCTKHLPVEIWPVSKCAEAFAYKEERGEEVFKIIFDWSK
ncbi:MAG: zinc-binding dehydrogenase [Victivallaceae bacterium]